MIIGVPKEIKPYEFRVAMTPEAARSLVSEGHQVLVEHQAGVGSGFSDQAFRENGARVVTNHREIFKHSDLILKVKEPWTGELRLFHPGQILFTFLHLAANPQVMRELLKRRVTALAYETVQTEDGRLSILAPMSEIAGKMAALLGANYLRKDLGGKGVVISGVGGKDRGQVLVLGVGNVGRHAAEVLYGMGAEVVLYDHDPVRLEALRKELGARCTVLHDPADLPQRVASSDLVIGAILVPGGKTPCLISTPMIQKMAAGSVIVDVAIDQGGTVAGIKPTTLKQPVYTKYGVLHCGVTNLPSLAARSATIALSAQTLPYIHKIANLGLDAALNSDPSLQKGLNLWDGKVVHPALVG